MHAYSAGLGQMTWIIWVTYVGHFLYSSYGFTGQEKYLDDLVCNIWLDFGKPTTYIQET